MESSSPNDIPPWINKHLLDYKRGIQIVEYDDYRGKVWYKYGKVHRDDDLHAVELPNGTKKWFIYGKLHRVNGPAIIGSNEHYIWYKYGKVHRDNGPARETKGSNQWWINGLRHRDDNKPAIEYKNVIRLLFHSDVGHDLKKYNIDSIRLGKGSEEYYVNGLRHRDDGPAVVWLSSPYSVREWWTHGELQHTECTAYGGSIKSATKR